MEEYDDMILIHLKYFFNQAEFANAHLPGMCTYNTGNIKMTYMYWSK